MKFLFYAMTIVMSNIYNNPQDFDKSDPENIKIKQILKDKESRTIQFKNVRFLSDILARLHLQELLEDVMVGYLGKKKEGTALSERTLGAIVKDFSSKFEVLMEHNESQNYQFVQSMSDLWHQIIQYINDADLLMQPPKHVDPLKSVMKQIFQFPHKADHSFGYYLSEYAGTKWLPFPFMDLMNKLHEDAIMHGSKSILADWSRSLNLILESLSPKE